MEKEGEFLRPESYGPDAPDQLVLMAEVALGDVRNTPIARDLLEWRRSKPVAYQEKLWELNRAYLEARVRKSDVTSVLVAPKDGEVCPCCGVEFYDVGLDDGGRRAREAMEAYLRANG